MKNLYRAILFLFIASTSRAQSYIGKGDNKINIGYEIYGIGNGFKATYDYGINSLFSIGAGATYYIDNKDDDFSIYARTSLHFGDLFDLPCMLDIYPGIELGYLSSNNVAIAGFIGARYFITERIGIYAEFGNNGSAGISVNL